MAYYLAIPPLTRPPVNSFDLLRNQLEGLVIEPLAARYAVERGLDKDPLAVFQVEQRRKQLMVDAMYRDSIESKVFVPVKERRAHYESHPNNYLTWPEVTYAAFAMPTQAGADSLAARLRAGEKPEAILLADSLAGIKRGAIHTRRKDFGGAYQKILFEELKPGQATVTRPDEAGDRAVLYLMHYKPETNHLRGGRRVRHREPDEPGRGEATGRVPGPASQEVLDRDVPGAAHEDPLRPALRQLGEVIPARNADLGEPYFFQGVQAGGRSAPWTWSHGPELVELSVTLRLEPCVPTRSLGPPASTLRVIARDENSMHIGCSHSTTRPGPGGWANTSRVSQ